MKILHVIGYKAYKNNYNKATRYYRLLDLLPNCNVINCFDLDTLKKNITDADLIILGAKSHKWIRFWDQLSFLKEFKKPTILFHADAWVPPLKIKTEFNITALMSTLDTLLNESRSTNKGNNRYSWEGLIDIPLIWCPPFMPLQEQITKDIDIITWGRVQKPYPFRAYIERILASFIISPPEVLTSNVYNVSLNDRIFSYARKKNQSSKGQSLYNFLSRGRICCTCSSKYKVPLGKFFENAGCHLISLTTPFTDAEALGFKDRENIWFTSEKTFIEDISYLLDNPEIVVNIANNAYKLIKEKHTPEIRALEMYNEFYKLTGVK